MSTKSNSLVIFILLAALLLENQAHHFDRHHGKTNKKCRDAVEKTTATPTSTTTPTPIVKATVRATRTTVESGCDNCGINATEPYCTCAFNHYPMPESGDCNDGQDEHWCGNYMEDCKCMRSNGLIACGCFSLPWN